MDSVEEKTKSCAKSLGPIARWDVDHQFRRPWDFHS